MKFPVSVSRERHKRHGQHEHGVWTIANDTQ